MTRRVISNLPKALLLTLFCRVLPLSAESTASVMTLEQAIAIALENNRDVKNAVLDVARAKEQVAVNRTYRLPSFNAYVLGGVQLSSVDLNLKRGDLGSLDGIGPVPAEDVTIESPGRFSALIVTQINQPISQLHRIGLGVKQAKLEVEVATEHLRAQEHSVIANVEKAYYSILQTQSSLTAAEQSIVFYKELDRVTEQYVLQRVSLRSDSLDVKTRLARSELDVLKLQDVLASQKEQLNSLLGRSVDTEFLVASVASAELHPIGLSEAQTRALAHRPEIRQARLKIEQAEIDRRAKKSEFIPDISLNFSHTSPIHYSEAIPGKVTTLGVAVNWNVFDWGRKKHEIAAKGATVHQAGNMLSEAESLVIREVNAGYRKLQRAAQSLRVAELGQQAAAESLRIATDNYKVSAILFKDVLQSESAMDQADDQYQQALLAFWSAKSEFEKSLGEDHE